MAINYTRFFDRFRAICDALAQVNTSQGTDVPTDIDTVLAEYDTDSLDGNPITAPLVRAVNAWSRSTSVASALASLARSTLLSEVQADAPHVRSVREAAAELIRQMRGGSQSVNANTVSIVVVNPDTAAPSLAMGSLDLEGYTLEHLLPEVIVGTGNDSGSVTLAGKARVSELRHEWPGGSGVRVTLSPVSGGLLFNPSFDAEDARDDTPDGWDLVAADVGTTLSITDTETQTVVISGTPTSGHYVLAWTTAAGSVVSTTPLPHNASGADLESALRVLPGLAQVEVSTTGTSPNYTHTVTFTGVRPGGNQANLSASDTFDTGGVAVTETAGGGQGATWKSLALTGDGEELTALRQRVALSPLAQYALQVQLRKDTGGTGVVVFELTDGEGTVLTDEAGSNNRLSVNLSAVADDDFDPFSTFFRTPKTLPEVIYLQIRLSTAINSGKTLFIDDCILAPAQQIYPGGPFAVLLANERAATADDRYTATVSNNQAGKLQTYFGRLFNRALLPSDAGGSETIAD